MRVCVCVCVCACGICVIQVCMCGTCTCMHVCLPFAPTFNNSSCRISKRISTLCSRGIRSCPRVIRVTSTSCRHALNSVEWAWATSKQRFRSTTVSRMEWISYRHDVRTLDGSRTMKLMAHTHTHTHTHRHRHTYIHTHTHIHTHMFLFQL